MSAIATEMFDAFITGNSMQSGIRKYLKENSHRIELDVAGDIALFVSEFKKKSEEWIKSNISGVEDILRSQKKANNVINDVSRICRETLGYTIVNKKRKGGVYHYVPEQWIPKARPVRVIASPTPTVTEVVRDMTIEECIRKHGATTVIDTLRKMYEHEGYSLLPVNNPKDLVADYIRIAGDLKPLAEAVVSAFKMEK